MTLLERDIVDLFYAIAPRYRSACSWVRFDRAKLPNWRPLSAFGLDWRSL